MSQVAHEHEENQEILVDIPEEKNLEQDFLQQFSGNILSIFTRSKINPSKVVEAANDARYQVTATLYREKGE